MEQEWVWCVRRRQRKPSASLLLDSRAKCSIVALHPFSGGEIAATKVQQLTQLLVAERQDNFSIWRRIIPYGKYLALYILFRRLTGNNDAEPPEAVAQIGRGLVNFRQS